MRDDWNRRASQDAWYAIDTMTQHGDMASFYSRSAELVPVLCDPVIELLGIQAENEIVLEIGCGIGRLFPGMSQRFREVWGIDISAVMVAEGEKNCPVEARWFVGDGSALTGIGDSAVGHVISFEVFQHVPRLSFIESYFREIFRVLDTDQSGKLAYSKILAQMEALAPRQTEAMGKWIRYVDELRLSV